MAVQKASLPKALLPTFNFFSTPGKHRSHGLFVEGHKLHVNGSSLAEHSEYFDACFFGNFQEASERVVKLDGERLEDVLLLLNAIGANPKEEKTGVNVVNCPRLLRLADKLLVSTLQRQCRNFLEKDFCLLTPTIEETLQLLLACEVVGITGTPLFNIASRLAGFGKEKLKGYKVHKLIMCPRLSAALFLAAEGAGGVKKNEHNGFFEEDKSKHNFGYGANGAQSTLVCSVYNCNEVNARQCHNCYFKFCPDHTLCECPRNAKAETKLVTMKTGWRTLDRDFL